MDLTLPASRMPFLYYALGLFMKESGCKVPYAYKPFAMMTFHYMHRWIYALPPLEDCYGYGMIELIDAVIENEESKYAKRRGKRFRLIKKQYEELRQKHEKHQVA